MKIIDVDVSDFMDLLVEPLKGKEAPELTDEIRERMRKPMTWEYNGWKEDEFSNDKDKEAGISIEDFLAYVEAHGLKQDIFYRLKK